MKTICYGRYNNNIYKEDQDIDLVAIKIDSVGKYIKDKNNKMMSSMSNVGPEELIALCQYYLSVGYYRKVQELVAAGQQSFGGGFGGQDSGAMQELTLWKAVSL